MKLTLTDINKITRGAVRIEEQPDGIHFHRFSAAQEQYYFGAGNTDFYNKTFATPCVELAFKTDAIALYFKAHTRPASSRGYFAVDFFVNGQKLDGIKNFDSVDHTSLCTPRPFGRVEKRLELTGESDVRIVFPWSAVLTLSELTLQGATYVTPVKRSKKAIMFGDSITHGYDAAYPSNSYAMRLGELLDAEVINKGIGGECFEPGLAAAKDAFIPDFITVAYGTNDWSNRARAPYTEKCRGFYKNLSENYPDTPIFAITPIWRAASVDPSVFGPFEDIIKVIKEQTADLKNVTVIEGFDFVPHESVHMADLTLHPNDEGFAHYAENLAKALKSYL